MLSSATGPISQAPRDMSSATADLSATTGPIPQAPEDMSPATCDISTATGPPPPAPVAEPPASTRTEPPADREKKPRGAPSAPPLRVAARVACTEAEGPGRRAAVWVQGCSLRCPGCCNPELFPADGGEPVPVAALADWLRAARDAHGLTGLTVLGGEPTEQLAAVGALCREARALGLGALVFTGRTLAELRALPDSDEFLASVDTLVDGRFDAARRDHERRWIGSTNQQIVHLTPRHADPAQWRGPDHVEVQIDPSGAVTTHGEPSLVRQLLRGQPRERRR